MKLVSIDMTDTSSNCPSGLRTLTSPRRLCATNIDGAGCSSVVFPVQGVKYSRVCGKIIGYQDGVVQMPFTVSLLAKQLLIRTMLMGSV